MAGWNLHFGALTWMLAATTGGATLLIGWRRPFAVLSFLILVVPFRDFGTRWLNVHSNLTVSQVTAIGRWWFPVIAGLLVVSAVRWARAHIRLRGFPHPDRVDIALAIVVIWGAVAMLTSSEPSTALTSYRGYLQPLMVFVLARLINPARRELRALLSIWFVVGMIIAGFALLQVATWDEATYRAEGYLRQDGSLVVPYAYFGGGQYLRPASTVSGPNELGADMLLLTLLAGFAAIHAGRRWRAPLVLLTLGFVGGLAVTVSRSAAIGLVAAVCAAALLSRKQLLAGFPGRGLCLRGRALLQGLALVAAAVVIFTGTGLLGFMMTTFANLRNDYHYIDSVEALQYLVQHPQGVGMGLVEPKGALSLIEAGGTYHVEGSLFQIAMEMGVWGLAVWLGFWGTTLARIWRNWGALDEPELQIVAGAAFAGWIGSLVAFVFLPLMQSISLMVWLWFLLGIGIESGSIERQWQLSNQAPD